MQKVSIEINGKKVSREIEDHTLVLYVEPLEK